MVLPDDSLSDLELRRKRLRYRVLGHFVDAHIEQFNSSDLARLEVLMDEQDTDLLRWVMGQVDVPKNVNAEMISRLADFQMKRAAT
jgi:antitoxin CptB